VTYTSPEAPKAVRGGPRRRAGAAITVAVAVIAAAVVSVLVVNRSTGKKANPSTQTTVPGAAPGGPQSRVGASVIHGIYVNSDVGTPIPASVLSAPSVDGVVLRFYWNTIEPNQGQFDFSALDQDIAAVTAAGKRYSLAVAAGNYAPGWIASGGARVLAFTVSPHRGAGNCRPINVPVPWDPVYLKDLDGMIAAVGANITGDAARFDAMTQVKVTGIGEYTDETRMPLETPAQSTGGCALTNAPAVWKANGYRPSLVEQAWNHMIDSWAAAFPGRSLGNNFITQSFPNIGENGQTEKGAGLALTKRLIDDGLARYGSRFAVQTQALQATSGTTAFVQDAGRRGATIGYQLAENHFGNPSCAGVKQAKNVVKAACDPTSLAEALQLGQSSGAAYIEVFPLTVAAYPPQLENAHAALDARTG
jgi:hypothetical protein